jgi:hypothetical protein
VTRSGLGIVSLVVSLVLAGATINGVHGVTLLHAEPTTFCLRVATDTGVLYDAGPGGTISDRRC